MAAPAATKALAAALETGSFAPVYYFHGDDDFRKEDAVRQVVAAAVDASLRDFNVDIRRGGDLDGDDLASLLAMMPMLAARRVVVVRDVDALKKGARDALTRYLAKPASDIVLVLVAPGGAKADKGIADASSAVPFDALEDAALVKWIAKRAKGLGSTITDDAIGLLQTAVGSDLQQLSAELEKLANFAGDGAIDAHAVEEIVGVRRGETPGDLMDAIASRDAKTALALLAPVLSQPKVSAVQIVMGLSSQTIAIAWLVARREQGLATGRLESELWGLLKGSGAFFPRPWPDAVKTIARAAAGRGWTRAACDRAVQALLETDLALKDSRVSSEEQLMSSLVLAMCAPDARGAA
jgi:DNA polymerase-3 subunit delta